MWLYSVRVDVYVHTLGCVHTHTHVHTPAYGCELVYVHVLFRRRAVLLYIVHVSEMSQLWQLVVKAVATRSTLMDVQHYFIGVWMFFKSFCVELRNQHTNQLC